MKNLLWIGDAACQSGFARATHGILDTLKDHYNVFVLGINYWGDPYDYPYKIWAAAPGGDAIGVGRTIWMCDTIHAETGRPVDVIVIQNDGWHFPYYMQTLKRFAEYVNVPVVGAVAVDGKNFQGRWLDGLDHAIFWTQFALNEARVGGYTGPASVIPLGVDLKTFYPMDQREARLRVIPSLMTNFIVGSVNRNQPRKRWDLMLRYFAEWVRGYGVKDAYLHLHVAPTGDSGIDVRQMASYYGILDRVALRQPHTYYGPADDEMRATYNCFDVCVSTSQGEGMGLPAMEAMACGVPCILPDWAAYGEWAGGGSAVLVPCTSTALNPVEPSLNVIGGVPDEAKFIAALNDLYERSAVRESYARSGLALMRQSDYRWGTIGLQWLGVLGSVLSPAAEEVTA